MKYIFLLILCACGSDDPCKLPSGNLTFIFSEIDGDCGPISAVSSPINGLGTCTNITEKDDCNYYLYDECEDYIQEWSFTIVNDDKIEGLVYLETYECSGVYGVVGVK